MGDVVPLKRPPGKGSGKGAALCRNGHHRWQVLKTLPFDVRRGRLVTVYRCERCGAERSRSE